MTSPCAGQEQLAMIPFLILWISMIPLFAISSESDQKTKIYNYSIGIRRKYMSMRFNSYIRVDGDPTERDISVTWLRNITSSIDMEVLYIVQTAEGNQVISKSFEPPTLCTGSHSSNNWDRSIVNICLRGVTNGVACPIQPETITPPYSFDIKVTVNQKLPWKILHFIMDLYPINEMESAAMLVLEGRAHLL